MLRELLSTSFDIVYSSSVHTPPTLPCADVSFLVHTDILNITSYEFPNTLKQLYPDPHIIAFGHGCFGTLLRYHGIRGFVPLSSSATEFKDQLTKCVKYKSGLFPPQNEYKVPSLTPIQRAYLISILNYLTPKDISQMHNVTPSTVTSHIRALCDKMASFYRDIGHPDFFIIDNLDPRSLQSLVLKTVRDDQLLYNTLMMLYKVDQISP